MAFSLGGASGQLSLNGMFKATKAEIAKLKDSQDSKTAQAKLNEVTVGSFNEKNSSTAPLAGTTAATDATAAATKAADGSATADDVKDAKGSETVVGAAREKVSDMMDSVSDTVDEWMDSASENETIKAMKDSIEETYDDIAKKAEEYGDMISDGIDTVTNKIDEITDKLQAEADALADWLHDGLASVKGYFCATNPFPQCSSCPQRDTSTVTIPNYLGMLNIAGNSLQKGLIDYVDKILDCPGMKNCMETGNYSGMVDAVQKNAVDALINGAVDVGSSAIFNKVSEMVPSGIKNTMKDKVPGLVNNSGNITYANLQATFTGLQIAGDGLMKIGSAVSTGQFTGIPGTSSFRGTYEGKEFSMKSLVSQSTFVKNSAARTSQDGMSLKMTGQQYKQAIQQMPETCILSTGSIKNAISTSRTRTRGITATRMASLSGTTVSTNTLKTTYALDNIKTGRAVPKDTRVRYYRGSSASLYAA